MSVNIDDSDSFCIAQSYAGIQQNFRVAKKPEKKRTCWDRVKEALADARLPTTQTYAAKLADVKQPSVSDWNKDGQGPELKNAIKLAKALNICVEWLYTERGPKRPGLPDDVHARRLWDLWPTISDENKANLVGYAAITAKESNGPLDRSKSNEL